MIFSLKRNYLQFLFKHQSVWEFILFLEVGSRLSEPAVVTWSRKATVGDA